MNDTNRLIHVEIDDTGQPAISPEVEQERRVAVFDLLESNRFELVERPGVEVRPGPFRLRLAHHSGRIAFDIADEGGTKLVEFQLLIGPFRQVIKNYLEICASYFNAVKFDPVSRIETIDMARRGIHDEGARILAERLEGKINVDDETSRRLFTLICALQPRR